MKKSVVSIYFPKRDMTLSYYNDQFDLQVGDIVYVEGKLEGLRGRVMEVSYNFKIKLSDYKKVIAVADTDVSGKFYSGDFHFITFDKKAIPSEKVLTWFKAPSSEDEYVTGQEDTDDVVYDLENIKIPNKLTEKSLEYYKENRVRYISVEKENGFAIVEGTHPYEVEFKVQNGKISNFICSCFCNGECKHQMAVLLELRDIFKFINKNYKEEYEESGYFAAVAKGLFFDVVIDGKKRCFEL